MKPDFAANIPIYLQIIDTIKKNIAKGKWLPGEKLPSVRELAVAFEVNPNTMQRALSELERDELLYTERTSGRFITKDEALLKNLKKEMAYQLKESYIKGMKELGYTDEEIKNSL